MYVVLELPSNNKFHIILANSFIGESIYKEVQPLVWPNVAKEKQIPVIRVKGKLPECHVARYSVTVWKSYRHIGILLWLRLLLEMLNILGNSFFNTHETINVAGKLIWKEAVEHIRIIGNHILYYGHTFYLRAPVQFLGYIAHAHSSTRIRICKNHLIGNQFLYIVCSLAPAYRIYRIYHVCYLQVFRGRVTRQLIIVIIKRRPILICYNLNVVPFRHQLTSQIMIERGYFAPVWICRSYNYNLHLPSPNLMQR